MSASIKIDPDKIIDRIGLKPGGKAHRYFMARTAEYMKPYLPWRDAGSVEVALDKGINYQEAKFYIVGPQMKYLFYGKAMAGNPRVPIDKDLVYTKSPHPKAGPFWDKQVQQNDADVIAQEVTDFIKKG